MKLKPDLTRDQLQQLTDRELLCQLLASTPLNLPRVFLFALLYTLMPCAVLGRTLGLLGTVGMSAVLAYLWLWGTPEVMTAFLGFWVVWSCLALGLALLLQLVAGVRRYVRGRRYLVAGEYFADGLKPGERTELSGNEVDGYECLVQVPERGIYVLILSVQNADSRVALSFDERACMTEYDFVPGLVNAACAAYRLDAGCHRLAVSVQGCASLRVCVRFW